MGEREKRALEILELYSIHKTIPASISGKNHIGETALDHLKLVNNILNHLCDEFNIQGDKRDILLAAGWLHDLGIYIITRAWDCSNLPGWIYYEKTGYCRFDELMTKHGSVGADEILHYNIKDKEKISKLVACHMSHWYKDEPQPKELLEYLLCIADYIASKGDKIFNYEKK